MTPPHTPAGWYADPTGSGGQRYWDGESWTDHHVPAHTPAEPTSTQQLPAAAGPVEMPPLAQSGGSHRANDSAAGDDPEDPGPSYSDGPLDSGPLDSGPMDSGPLYTGPTYSEPTYTSPSYTSPSFDGLAPGTATSARGNRKVILGFAAGVGVLVLILIVVIVYGVFIHQPDKVQISAPSTSTETSTTSTTAAPTSVPPAAGASTGGIGDSVSDGPVTFVVTGVESASTVTDPTNSDLTKTAQGQYFVVHLTVTNAGDATITFLSPLQKLKAGGTSFDADDEASYYIGTSADGVDPGYQLQTSLAFDVPPGTVPDSIELHALPTSPGAEVRLQ
jgi:hypothetical protein